MWNRSTKKYLIETLVALDAIGYTSAFNLTLFFSFHKKYRNAQFVVFHHIFYAAASLTKMTYNGKVKGTLRLILN